MAKTPQQWRSEWRKLFIFMAYPFPMPYNKTFMRKFNQPQRANCVLGYARSRGWYNV